MTGQHDTFRLAWARRDQSSGGSFRVASPTRRQGARVIENGVRHPESSGRPRQDVPSARICVAMVGLARR